MRPANLEEAVRLLGEHDGARALAGGQTLVNVMKQRAASPDVLVDLAKLDELQTIGFSADGSALELGSMVTLSRLMSSSEVEVARPILAEVAGTVADVQVRNRGTLGGESLRQRPDQPFPAAGGCARRVADDPLGRGRANRDGRRVLRRRLRDARGGGRSAHADLDPDPLAGRRRCDERRDARCARHVRRQRGGLASPAACGG